MTSRILDMAVLAALTLITLACNGDNRPTPTATTTDGTSIPSASTRSSTGGPAAKGWRTLAPMPTPRSEVAAAEFNDEIYVIGGFEGDGSPSAKVEAYDPASDTWRQVQPLPEPRQHAAAFVFGTPFVMGGFKTGFNDP